MTRLDRSIVVVDAHAAIAASLAIALRHAGFASTTSVHPDALALDAEGRPEGVERGAIILLGLLFGDGRTALPLIQPLVDGGCRVVVMTVDQGLPLVGDCLRSGAEAVLGRDMPFERLVEWLGVLVAGGVVMAEDERRALLESVDQHHVASDALVRPFAALTTRETEVLTGLVGGFAPKQIALSQGTSVSTVRGHIQRVLRKLDVSSQREALAMARNSGWPRTAS